MHKMVDKAPKLFLEKLFILLRTKVFEDETLISKRVHPQMTNQVFEIFHKRAVKTPTKFNLVALNPMAHFQHLLKSVCYFKKKL